MAKRSKGRRLLNYIRMHRRRSGLSQRDLEEVLGYCEGSVSQHEQFRANPSLRTALAYEVIFRIPIADIFSGLRESIEEQIESRLAAMESKLGQRSGRDHSANATARKLIWLAQRRNPDLA